jgi:UDP-2,3-diacylglucosamine hydrolase
MVETTPREDSTPNDAATLPIALQEIDAQDWSVIEFISDLHLQRSEPKGFDAFETYLRHTQAQALFILGDLFELWVGDDLLSHEAGDFALQCVRCLKQASERLSIFLLPGNRDFLLGEVFFKETGVKRMADPCVLRTQQQRFLLSHGDAWCTRDLEYQSFRTTVRGESWQAQFLAQPLETRLERALKMRSQSAERQQTQREHANHEFFDLDPQACREALLAHHCTTLIHGHTHRPQEHDLGDGYRRVVLSHWDADTRPTHLEVLQLKGQTLHRT